MTTNFRPLTAQQQRDWDFALFGPPPLSVPEWRLSTAFFASGSRDFLRANRAARWLYLSMCQADLGDPDLFTTSDEKYQTLEAWDFLLRLHNPLAPQGKLQLSDGAVGTEPVSGRFAAVETREVRPRAMSRTEVQGIVGRPNGSLQPFYASLPNKAAFKAAVGRDPRLCKLFSTRYAMPLPSKQHIASIIPPQGISIRDLMLTFAPRLCINTVANFVERVFLISAVDPTSKKLLPIMSIIQAEALQPGRYRDVMIRAARSCSPPAQNHGTSKVLAFRHEEMASYFFNQVREVRVSRSNARGRKEKIWYYKSEAADEKTMKELEPLIEQAERKGREEVQTVTEQYTVQKKGLGVRRKRKRNDSVVCAANALLSAGSAEM